MTSSEDLLVGVSVLTKDIKVLLEGACLRELAYGRQFEKSLKLAKRRKKNLNKLFMLVELLRQDETIPARHRNHKLVGEYEGYWELHIEPDWLLVYKKTTDQLFLFDTGTHADLFE